MSDIVYVKCPYCGEDIESDSVRCDQCGEELMICPSCRKFGKDKFCTDCGKAFEKASEFAKKQAPPAPQVQQPVQQVQQPVAPQQPFAPQQPMQQPMQQPVQQPVAPQQFAPQQPIQQPVQPQYQAPQQASGYGWHGPSTNPDGHTGTSLPGSMGGNPGAPMPGQPSMLSCRMMNISIPLRDGTLLGRVYGDFVQQLCVLPSLSGSHARIALMNGMWTITDVGSSYGTTVNGTPCQPNQPVVLKSGYEVCFARSYTFKVL